MKLIYSLAISLLLTLTSFYPFPISSDEKIKKAEELEKENRLDEAEEIWNSLYESYPNNASYAYHLGKLYSRQQRFTEAEGLLKKGLQLEPSNMDILLSLSYVYLWSEQFDEAEEGFKEILRTQPDNEDAFNGLQQTQEQAITQETLIKLLPESKTKADVLNYAAELEAQNQLDKAEEIWLSLYNSDPHNTLYIYHLGKLYARQQHFVEAENLLKKGLQLEPSNMDILLSLSYVYLWSDKLKEAEEGFKEILRTQPDNEDAKKGLHQAQEQEQAAKAPKETKPKLDVDQAIKEATELEKKEEFDKAEEIWLSLCQSDPQNATYLYQLGKCYLQEKKFDKAEEPLKKALELTSSYNDVLLNLCNAHLLSGKLKIQEAEQGFKEILRTEPDNEEAKKGLSQIEKLASEKEQEASKPESEQKITEATELEKKEEFDKAEAIWLSLQQSDPQNATYLYRLGKVYSQQQRFDRAEELLKKASELQPTDADILLSLSYVYLWSGKLKEAEEGFSKILREHPDYADAEKGLKQAKEKAIAKTEEKKKEPEEEKKVKPEAEQKIAEATELEKKEEFGKAEEVWLSLQQSDPQNATYLYRLGKVYSQQKKFDKAEEVLKKASELQPADADILLSLSYVYLWSGKLKEAEEGFSKILKEHPDYADAEKGLKQAKEEAIAKTEEKNKEKKKADPLIEYAIKYAQALEKCGLLERAGAIWAGIYCQDPNNSTYAFYYGQNLAWRGCKRRAEYLLWESIRLDPKNQAAWLRLGYLYLFTQRLDEAQGVFTLMIDTNPKDGDAHAGLAKTLLAQREMTAAKWEYEEALSLAPDDFTLWLGYKETKRYTRPWPKFQAFYAQDKEDDLFTGKPSVTHKFWRLSGLLYLPVYDQFRVFVGAHRAYEDEYNIVGKRYDYQVYYEGFTLGEDYLINPLWRLTAQARIFHAHGENNELVAYPFQDTTKVEPSLLLVRETYYSKFFLSLYRDSIVVKDFVSLTSELISRNTIEVIYELQDWPRNLYLGVSGYWRRIFDHPRNTERRGSVWLQLPYPKYNDWAYVRYQVNFGGFDHTQTNYYSFKRQWEHLATFAVFKRGPGCYAEANYQRGWRWTRDLSQPTTSVQFIERQYLIINKIAFVITKSFNYIDLNGETYYYSDSSGYKSWVVRGEISWVF